MNKRIGLLSYALLSSVFFIENVSALDISVPVVTGIDMATTTPITFSGSGAVTGTANAFTTTDVARNILLTVSDTTAAKEISTTLNAFEVPATYGPTAGASSISLVVNTGAVVESTNDTYFFNSGVASTGPMTVTNAGTMTSLTGHALKVNSGVARTNNFLFTNQAGGVMNALSSNKAGLHTNLTSGGTSRVTLNNLGTINADRGVWIDNAGAASGIVTLINSGTINAENQQGILYGTHASVASVITNTSTGAIISKKGHAIELTTGINGVGNLSNFGTITATASATHGVVVGQALPLLDNYGTIQTLGASALSYGILKNGAGTLTTLNNNVGATISSAGGPAISVGAGVIGTIRNSGTISRGSLTTTAIDLSAQTTAAAIFQNAGMITGNILFTNQNETVTPALTLNGGTIVGTIDGTAGGNKTITINGGTLTGPINLSSLSTNTVNFTAPFTTGGTIANAKTVALTNRGTLVTVTNNITGLDTALTLAAGTTFFIKNGVTVSPTVGLTTLTNAGTLQFEIGRGVDTTYAAINNNTNGLLDLKALGTATNAATGLYAVTQTGSGYIGHLARFYVIKAVSNLNNTTTIPAANFNASAANTPFLSFSLKGDNANVYIEAARTSPTAMNFGRVDSLTEKVSRPVLVAIEEIGTTNNSATMALMHPVMGGLQTLATVNQIAEESSRLAPSMNGHNTNSVNVATQTVVHNTIMQRLSGLRDNVSNGRYSAGDEAGPNVWVQAGRSRLAQGNMEGITGYDGVTHGAALGLDGHGLPGVIAGVAGAYTRTGVSSRHAVQDKTEVHSLTGEIYGSYELNPHFYLDAAMYYTRHQYRHKRFVTLAATPTIANAMYYGVQYGASLIAGYRLNVGETVLTPMVGLKGSALKIESYTETDASNGLNLQVGNRSFGEKTLVGGARWSWNFDGHGGRLQPEVHALLNYDFRASSSRTASQFVVSGAPVGSTFISEGPSPVKRSANVGASLLVSSLHHWNVTAHYDYVGRKQFSANTGMLNIRYIW